MHRHLLGLMAMMMSLGMTQATWGKTKEKTPTDPQYERSAWFMENKGQIRDQHGNPRPEIDFRMKAHGQLSVFISNQGMDYQWYFPDDSFSYRLEVRILGGNPKSSPIPKQANDYTEYYYRNGESMQAKAWERLVYPEIYPGIDWVIYKKGDHLEYDFILHPGADIRQIQMVYHGAQSLSLDTLGGLLVKTPYSEIRESAPLAFLDNGQSIPCSFRVQGNTIGFSSPEYEDGLRIDPVVEWGTYLGGSLSDIANMVRRSPSGHVYMTGGTASLHDIATVGAFHQTYQGGTGGLIFLGDAYLAKFDTSGQCLWSTYFGGSGEDQAYAVAPLDSHSVYIAGATKSLSGMATTGAHQSSLAGGSDAFLAKFRSDGSLIWSTYYGGTGDESLWVTLSAEEGGAVYMAFPTTSSSGIATSGTHQQVFGGFMDIGLVQFDSSGSFQWGSYFGGSGMDIPFQIEVDDYSHLYMAGFTGSATQIASTGSHQPSMGGMDDGFIAKFDDQGQVIWSSYYGGTGTDRLTAVLPVGDSAIYLLGTTNSPTGMITTGAYQTSLAGGADAFFARMDTSGQRQWASYFGGPSSEYPTSSLALGAHGDLYFGGFTQSSTGIASAGAISQNIQGGMDGMLARFRPQGQIVWSTYIGGPGIDVIQSIDTDPYGYLYLCGETTSGTGIADSSSHQSSFGGGYRDALLMMISDCDTPATPGLIQGPVMACYQQATHYMIPPVPGAISYSWSLPPGWTGTSQTNTIIVHPGSQAGTLTVQALSYCSASAPSSLPVQSSAVAIIQPGGPDIICPGDSLELSSGNLGTRYEWFFDGVSISTSSSVFVQDSGFYQLIIEEAHCSDSSALFELQHWDLPKPTIQYDGQFLFTDSTYLSYQWYFNGTTITGANQYRWNPVALGPYQVEVSDSNGCQNSSEIYPLNLAHSHPNSTFQIYPNPAGDYIELKGIDQVSGTITLINAQGQKVRTTQLQPRISLREIHPGIYWIIIRDNRGQWLHSQPLVKD